MEKLKFKVLVIAAFLFIFVSSLIISGCSENTDEIGIGPVKKVNLAALDKSLSDNGKQIFDIKCVACHKLDSKLVGPALKGVTARRKPEWIMNMILNPEQMTKENPVAKQLFATHLVQMTFQNVTENDARAILEYFRSVDGQ